MKILLLRCLSVIMLPICFISADGILMHTKVKTKKGYIPVEKIRIGDHIMSFSATFEPEVSTVEHIIVQTNAYAVRLSINNEDIHLAPYQKVYLPLHNAWLESRKLHAGDTILKRDGSHLHIQHIDIVDQPQKVYVLIQSLGQHILSLTQHDILVHHSDKVVDLLDLFKRDETFARTLAQSMQRTPWSHKSAHIYVVTKDLPQYKLKFGDLFYLDKLHFDHIEVFNNHGSEPTNVLNLDGSINALKFKIAQEEHRTLSAFLQ